MKKIAVVEDNPDNRLLVRVILESLYEVTEYENGLTALAGLPRQIPELVLLDISLPEMDGSEVLRRMRADARLKNLPVIALTAHAMTGDREKYLAAGFDDYVTKPIVDENLLLHAIEKLLVTAPAPAVVSPPANCFVEVGALERLRKLGGDSFAAEMITLFLEYTQTKIAEARTALAAGDLAGVGKAAHPIKSSAGNVGAVQVQELAAQIEQLAKPPGAVAGLAELLGQLDQAFAASKLNLAAAKEKLERPPA